MHHVIEMDTELLHSVKGRSKRYSIVEMDNKECSSDVGTVFFASKSKRQAAKGVVIMVNFCVHTHLNPSCPDNLLPLYFLLNKPSFLFKSTTSCHLASVCVFFLLCVHACASVLPLPRTVKISNVGT